MSGEDYIGCILYDLKCGNMGEGWFPHRICGICYFVYLATENRTNKEHA